MSSETLHVSAVCTGNICRSPMAEVVLKALVASDGDLTGHVLVTSAGTARWHVGAAMDPRARAALDRGGLTLSGTSARYADGPYLDEQDLILVMTGEHRREVRERLTNNSTEVLLWRELSEPGHDLEVADPYYGGDDDFDRCLAELRRSVPRLREELRRRRDARSSGA